MDGVGKEREQVGKGKKKGVGGGGGKETSKRVITLHISEIMKFAF